MAPRRSTASRHVQVVACLVGVEVVVPGEHDLVVELRHVSRQRPRRVVDPLLEPEIGLERLSKAWVAEFDRTPRILRAPAGRFAREDVPVVRRAGLAVAQLGRRGSPPACRRRCLVDRRHLVGHGSVVVDVDDVVARVRDRVPREHRRLLEVRADLGGRGEALSSRVAGSGASVETGSREGDTLAGHLGDVDDLERTRCARCRSARLMKCAVMYQL